MIPTRGILAGCCARGSIGQAAAAPPARAMKSRRLMPVAICFFRRKDSVLVQHDSRLTRFNLPRYEMVHGRCAPAFSGMAGGNESADRRNVIGAAAKGRALPQNRPAAGHMIHLSLR